MTRILIAGFYLIFIAQFAAAQTELLSNDTVPFYQMSIEQLMDVNVTVASQQPMTSRESPGIITILTKEEIKKSGANELMDVLRFVPGLNFGVDVDGVIGIGVRGNWANEGKTLLLWDGMELNEDLYSTLQFGGHYSLDNVNRIEIIRGPGSAMYGGNAEYAVINVVTENNSRFEGVAASAVNSWMSKTYGSRGVSFSTGKTLGPTHVNLSASFNQGNRSQEIYTDYTGKSYDMSGGSALGNSKVRMDFFLKGLSITGRYESHMIEQRDGYDEIYLRSYETKFNSGFISAKYEFKPNENLVITPGFRFKFQRPWSYLKNITDDDFVPFDTRVNKKEFYVNASYNPDSKINLLGGLNYYHQLATQGFDTMYFSNGSREFNIDNYAGYFQGIFKLNIFNVIPGIRFEYNPIYGSSLVPRMGITKVWKKYHVKALYSKAFRTPSVENINASPDILPEKTLVAEFEAGFMVTPQSYFTVNAYDITTNDPIIYYYDENQEDKYKNDVTTGSRGIEAEYKWKSTGWYASVNYACFTTAGHEVVSIYQAPGHPDNVLAFPSNKINATGNVHLSKHVNVSAAISRLSKRYSFSQDEAGNPYSIEHRPTLYANLILNFENIFNKGFCIQASCNNLTDERIIYIQPYDGLHQPLPGTSREYQLKLTYNFSFSENK